jgi:phage-related protein
MAQYDGIIRIDTEIDTDNAVTDSKELISAMKQLQNELSKMSKEISTAFNDFDTTKMQNETKKATKSTKQATKDISADVTKLQLDIAKWESEIAKIEEAYAKLDPSIDDESLRKMLINNELWFKYLELIDDAERKMKDLQAPPLPPSVNNADTDSNTKNVKENTEEIKKNNSARNSSVSGMQKQVSVINKMNNSMLKNNKQISNFSKNMKASKGSVDSIGKSFKNLGRQIGTVILYSALFSAISKITESTSRLLRVNSQFSKSLAQIKGNLMTAFVPIYQNIMPILNAFMVTLVRVTGYLAQFTNLIFGTSIKSSQDYAKTLYDQAFATEKVAKATKKASDNLAKFDELNVAQKTEKIEEPKATDLTEPIPPTFDDIELTKGVNRFIDKLNELRAVVQPTIDALKKLWDEGLKPFTLFVFKSLEDFYNNFLVPIGVWTFGEGLPRLINAITDMLDIDWSKLNISLERFWKALSPLVIAALDGALTAVEGALFLIGQALKLIAEVVAPVALDAISGFLEDVDPELAKSIGFALGVVAVGLTAISAVKGVAALLGGITAAFSAINPILAASVGAVSGVYLAFKEWEKLFAMQPSMEEFFNALNEFLFGDSLNILSYAGEQIGIAFDHLKESLDSLKDFDFEGFINEFILFGESILEGLTFGLIGGINLVLEPIYKIAMAIVEYFADLLGINSPSKVFIQFGKDIVNGLINGITGLINSVKTTVTKLYTSITGVFSTSFSKFREIAKSMITGIKDYFKWDNLKDRINSVWNSIRTPFSNAFSKFREIGRSMINGIKDYFKWENIKDRINSVWTSIKNVFVNARSSFKNVGTNILNGIKDNLTTDKLKDALTKPFKGAINAVIALFNSMIDAVNKSLKFTWDAIKIAGKTIVPSGSVTIAKLPKIPKLATGMAIPANYGEFQAILGDSKEPEVVSPISMMKQAFKEAFAESGGSSGGVIHNYIVLDGKVVSESVFNYGKKYKNQTGRSPI